MHFKDFADEEDICSIVGLSFYSIKIAMFAKKALCWLMICKLRHIALED